MSERTAALSAREREVGFRNFMKHITWNGLGVFLLNHTIVSLMAIEFGASNLEIGYINSAFHVTGLASVFVPRLFRGVRINKLFGWGWMVRGVTALFYGLLLVLSGPAARFTIVVIFTAFSLSRTVGVSVVHAVQRDIMRSRDASGSFVRFNIRLGWSQLVAQLLSFALLTITFFDGLLGLVAITYIGAAMNTVSAYYLLKVPGRGVVEESGGRNTVQTFVWSMKRREHAMPLMVHWLGVGLVVMFGFQIVFLRRVLDLPNNISILIIVLEAVSAIIANSALKPFADNVGDKPLLVISSIGLTVVALTWAFIPGTLPLPVYFVLGFVSFLFVRSLLTLKGSVMVKSIPERNRVAYTSAANVMLAVVALVIGLVGGGLADLATLASGWVVHTYSLTFLFTAALAAVVAVISARLPGDRDMSLRQTADIMLSARNLRAFLDAYQLDFAADPARRDTLLLSLERSSTPVATSHLRQRLKGPLVSEKEQVFRTLFRTPRPELLEDILTEARDPASYTRRDAVFCLGAYEEPAAEAVLREIAGLPAAELGGNGPSGAGHRSAAPDITRGSNVARNSDIARKSDMERDPDIEVVAIALKSLARHGVEDALAAVRELLEQSLPTRAQLDLSVAEAILDPSGPQLRELFARAFAHESERFATTKIMIAFSRLDLDPSLETYLRAEVRSAGRGFDDLIEDASEFTVVQAQHGQLRRWVSIGEFNTLRHWVLEQLPGSYAHDWAGYLDESLRNAEPPARLERLAALCALYTLHRCLESNEYTD